MIPHFYRAILSQFTVEQMGRYESFRRSNFQKSNMRRVMQICISCYHCLTPFCLQLLTSITGSQKIYMPLTIVVSGIAKIFVGELVETGK
ncbi:hypothetical protein Taro_011045 [Colocasia esculenta]|uniref:TAFII28-like protein domain-containing protein n=1 Tax=Colocasia esculenta TaxID=4460 RepID=A0A843U8T3_COLES|nr:hypothetical protein [Colocasia esculenta]